MGWRAVRAHRPLGVPRLAVHSEPGTLERVLGVFVTHYNEHRTHRALSLAPPEPRRSSVASAAGAVRVYGRNRLSGVIREYILAA